jgi:hypothetical protein
MHGDASYFVDIAVTKKNMRAVALALCKGDPILLEGVTGMFESLLALSFCRLPRMFIYFRFWLTLFRCRVFSILFLAFAFRVFRCISCRVVLG